MVLLKMQLSHCVLGLNQWSTVNSGSEVNMPPRTSSTSGVTPHVGFEQEPRSRVRKPALKEEDLRVCSFRNAQNFEFVCKPRHQHTASVDSWGQDRVRGEKKAGP
jgi:uncharacterized membrane protein YagU involved in acid resistance